MSSHKQRKTALSGEITSTTDWGGDSIKFIKQGRVVTLKFSDIGQSDATTTIATGIAEGIRPSADCAGLFLYEDNNINGPTKITVTATGDILYPDNTGNGDDVLLGTVTYMLD